MSQATSQLLSALYSHSPSDEERFEFEKEINAYQKFIKKNFKLSKENMLYQLKLIEFFQNTVQRNKKHTYD